MWFFTRLFSRDAELAAIKQQVAQLASEVELLKLERSQLLEIVERDRRRIEAEVKAYGAKIVESERAAK